MKIRLMGTTEELSRFEKTIKQIPGIDILEISKPYVNRGSSAYSRVYIDCRLNTVYTQAELVEPLLLEENICTERKTKQ